MDTTKHPGDDEYLGAILQYQEQFLSPSPRIPQIGEHVAGISGGRAWSGTVEHVANERITVNCGDAWVNAPLSDVNS